MLCRIMMPIFFCVLLVATMAHAQIASTPKAAYMRPSQEQLTLSYIAMGGVNIEIPEYTDLYLRGVYCEDFKKTEGKDLERIQLRKDLVERFKLFREPFVRQYEIVSAIRLQPYDDIEQKFLVHEEDAPINLRWLPLLFMKQDNIGEIQSYTGMNSCIQSLESYVILIEDNSNYNGFGVRLSETFSFSALSLSKEKADFLSKFFERTKNKERTIYLRMGVSLDSAVRFVDKMKSLSFNGKIDFAELYLDPDLSQFLMTVDLDKE